MLLDVPKFIEESGIEYLTQLYVEDVQEFAEDCTDLVLYTAKEVLALWRFFGCEERPVADASSFNTVVVESPQMLTREMTTDAWHALESCKPEDVQASHVDCRGLLGPLADVPVTDIVKSPHLVSSLTHVACLPPL